MNESNTGGDSHAKRINNYYLVNNDEDSEELRQKLVLTKGDKETLVNLIENRELSASPYNKILQNYNFFKEQIHKSQIEVHRIHVGIGKLFIVDISLERDKDNPQLIFESLNSTGLELSQADLIRNFMLMRLTSKEQEMIYNEYWYPMEREFEQPDYEIYFNRFMRDYLTMELGRIPNMADVYSEFKSYVYSRNKSILEIVMKIKQYSKIFSILVYARDEDNRVNEVIKDINKLKVEVSYPFLMQVFIDYRKGSISKAEFIQIMRTIESYVYRRAICGISTSSLNKIFTMLMKE
jgi:uncharacterized protein with ParB-like and HNH nuclease domain